MTQKCEICEQEVTKEVAENSKTSFAGRILCDGCQKLERVQVEGTIKSAADDHAAEVKRARAEIMSLFDTLSDEAKKAFPAWLESEYKVENVTQLPVSKLAEVITNMKMLRETESTEPAASAQEAQEAQEKPDPKGDVMAREAQIEWGDIPQQTLHDKLARAREYQCREVDGAYRVYRNRNDVGHMVRYERDIKGQHVRTLLNTCDCDDWKHRGSTINPCIHMCRVSYTDAEIDELTKGATIEPPKQPNAKLKTVTKDTSKKQTKGTTLATVQPTPKPLITLQQQREDTERSTLRMAEIGKIKIGGKVAGKRDGQLLPNKWDHFKIATLVKEGDMLVLDDEMNKLIGDDCTALDIGLCYDDIGMNFQEYYSLPWASRDKCVGNGKTATRTLEGQERQDVTCNPNTCAFGKDHKCVKKGRLSVILQKANRIGGVYMFRTQSYHTIQYIKSSLRFLSNQTGGILAGIPLQIRVLPMSVTPAHLDKQVRVYVVNIEFPGTMDELVQAAIHEFDRRVSLNRDMQKIEAQDREYVTVLGADDAGDAGDDVIDVPGGHPDDN